MVYLPTFTNHTWDGMGYYSLPFWGNNSNRRKLPGRYKWVRLNHWPRRIEAHQGYPIKTHLEIGWGFSPARDSWFGCRRWKCVWENDSYLEPFDDLYFWRSTPQNKAEIPIKTRVSWVPGSWCLSLQPLWKSMIVNLEHETPSRGEK